MIEIYGNEYPSSESLEVTGAEPTTYIATSRQYGKTWIGNLNSNINFAPMTVAGTGHLWDPNWIWDVKIADDYLDRIKEITLASRPAGAGSVLVHGEKEEWNLINANTLKESEYQNILDFHDHSLKNISLINNVFLNQLKIALLWIFSFSLFAFSGYEGYTYLEPFNNVMEFLAVFHGGLGFILAMFASAGMKALGDKNI